MHAVYRVVVVVVVLDFPPPYVCAAADAAVCPRPSEGARSYTRVPRSVMGAGRGVAGGCLTGTGWVGYDG